MRRFWLRLVATLVLLLGLWQPPAAVSAGEARNPELPYRQGEILVKLRGGVIIQEIDTLFADPAVQIRGTFPPIGVMWLSVPVGQEIDRAARLARNPDVEFAQPNWIYHLDAEPNDPLYPQQWALTRTVGTPLTNTINAPAAWDVTTGDPGIVVAVVDSGIDLDHPDLAGAIWTNPNPTMTPPDIHGWNFISNTNNIVDDMDPALGAPLPSHGTHVGGIIAARFNNGVGIAGLAGTVTIMPVKSADQYGSLTSWSIVQGIRYAVDHGARVLNFSFGSAEPDPSVAEAVNYALARGVVVVAAAGNFALQGNPVTYPASLPGVLAVSNLGRNGQRYRSSEYGPYVGVAAPGESIWSTVFFTSTGTHTFLPLTGTSMATPYVSALAALILSVNPDLTNAEVGQIVTSTASLAPNRNDDLGYGVINAGAAVQPLRLQPSTLQMYPIAGAGGTTAQLVNVGAAAGSWRAETTTPWLRLGSVAGRLPSTVTVSIDTSKLPAPGPQLGFITVTTQLTTSIASTQVVTVTARGGKAVYLPLVAQGWSAGW